jgi:polar amino acid transport system permease protein
MIDWIQLFITALPTYMSGLWVTLQLTVVGLAMGFMLGLVTALARVYGPKWLKALAVSYIEIFRGTPLLVQLFLIYYGLPGIGITLDRLPAAFLALGLNSGAYQAEYLRGSLLAIGEGQMMAGRAIGMSRWNTIRFIILPQAMRLVIPSWSNEPIALLKATSVVFLIAVPELMTRAKALATRTYDPIGAYLVAAVFYMVVVFLIAEGLKSVERRTKIPGMGGLETFKTG